MRALYLLVALLAVNAYDGPGHDTVSSVNPDKYSIAKDRRYLLYDVNPGEGFNLRRDVHMRVANLVRRLREEGHNFVLVLPPFGGIYHWQSRELGHQIQIPWKRWFDLESLNRFTPSIEFSEFVKETGVATATIGHVYYLQHYAEGWGSKGWEEKWNFRPCIDGERYYENDPETGKWLGWFWGYSGEVSALKLDCISIQGQSSSLLPLVLQKNLTTNSIMIDRAETVLHDHFGDVHYWNTSENCLAKRFGDLNRKNEARRSMRYSKELRNYADKYREEELDSTDEKDKTVLDEDWTKSKIVSGSALGGPYLGVHWRRKDFVRAHGKEIPSIKGAAEQIEALLKKLELNVVFLATDAPEKEVTELLSHLPQGRVLKQFVPEPEIKKKFLDGGISIIDQWICSHARYFIGSHVSTFSFRIQDEREILGFDPNTTFNRMCPDKTPDCEQPAHWTLVQK